MEKLRGTENKVPILVFLCAFTLLCAVSAFGQDKLLITPANKTLADPASVNCWQYASDGTTCIGGQYFHSDNTTPTTNWTPVGTTTAFGAWTTSPNNGSTSGCLSCHHSSLNALESNGNSRGGAYLIGGHKNILRKVVPGQPLLNSEGLVVSTVADHNGTLYNMDWSTGLINPGGLTAYVLAGWTPEPDVFGAGSTLAYGSCGRCHTTGYRFDDNGPEPTQVTLGTPNTYTKLTSAQFGRTPAGSASPATSSWYLTGINCERCHKVDMQVDPSLLGSGSPSGTVTVNGRIAHHGVGGPLDTVNGKTNRNFATVPNDGIDHTVTPYRIPGTDLTLTGAAGTIVEPGITAPYALLCVECHQAYSTWTNKTAGQVGQTHMTPLPGFESLVPVMDATKFTTTKAATGQFSATWGCTGTSASVATNDYDGCIAAGGKVTYVPGGMSHGAVTTILNSPHGRVSGYVDAKNPATADSTLTINGGTLPDGTAVKGQFNTFFASESGVAGACTGCHNVHGYMEGYVQTNATNVQETLVGCATCHMNGSRYSVSMPNHSKGNGTPFPDGADQSKSCTICHMMGAGAGGSVTYHFLRINPNVNYTTFPDAKTYYTTVGSGKFGKLNTYNSGETYKDANGVTRPYPAVALDVDMACGQCHTGGNGKNPYGLVPTAAPAYTRAQLSTFATGIHNTVPKTAQSPTFSMAGSTYTAPISVVIYEATPNAQICYTTDGTTPVWQDTTPTAEIATMSCKVGTQIQSGGSVNINQTTTLKAVGGGTNSIGNVLTPSAVASRTYTINIVPTAPTFSPASGSILTKGPTATVTINAQAGMTIYYTLNGSIPTSTVSSTNFLCGVGTCQTTALPVSGYVRAIAVASGGQKSAVTTAVYTVR